MNVVSGPFDNMMSRDIRLLHEVSRAGNLQVMLWSDAKVERASGKPPKFPQEERQYFIESMRFVTQVEISDDDSLPGLPQLEDSILRQYPTQDFFESARMWTLPTSRKKVVVTGCFDWFHSGHVRFFEEASEIGDLYVVVGSDANITLLKGKGHPLFPAVERQYIVGSMKFVRQALISTGTGWMDAEPEFAQIKPDIYVVNEDGDKPDKKAWCEAHGVEYRVLKRLPRPGLPKRQSTVLRGF